MRDLGTKVAALLNANLSAEAQIITVERAELEKVLGEQELGRLLLQNLLHALQRGDRLIQGQRRLSKFSDPGRVVDQISRHRLLEVFQVVGLKVAGQLQRGLGRVTGIRWDPS